MFSSIVKDCVYAHILGQCDKTLAAANATLNGITPAIQQTYTTIRNAAPNAKVIVFGYVAFWGQAQCDDLFLIMPSKKQKAAMNNLVTGANTVLGNIVSQYPGFEFVDVSPAFEGHRLCDTAINDPWFQYEIFDLDLKERNEPVALEKRAFYNEGVFHPTLEGQSVYTRGLVSQLGC